MWNFNLLFYSKSNVRILIFEDEKTYRNYRLKSEFTWFVKSFVVCFTLYFLYRFFPNYRNFLGNSLEDFGREKTPFQTLIIHFFDLLGLFFIVFLFRKEVDKDTFINLGFHLDQGIKDIVYGILVGFIIMAVVF